MALDNRFGLPLLAFLPGFTDALVGANEGDELTVNVTLPDDFPIDAYDDSPHRIDAGTVGIWASDTSYVDDLRVAHELLHTHYEARLPRGIR